MTMNKIFITGDIHSDPTRLSSHSFIEQKELDKNDFVIIAGDFGLIWDTKESSYEKKWLDWLDKKKFTTLFIDGNHENFDRLNAMPVSDWHGGKVHKIRDSVIHLMRGEIYNINNKTIFAFGGAPSHDINGLASPVELDKNYAAGILDESDKEFKNKLITLKRAGLAYRVNHRTWWKEEMPNDIEYQNGLDNLEKHDFNIDYVITHEAPASSAALLGFYNNANTLSKYLENIKAKLNYKPWFFGHYHVNKRVDANITCLYEQIIRIC